MALYLGSQKISSVITAYGTTTFDTSDATALAKHIQLGYTAYVDGKKITGTMDPGPDTIKTGVTIAGVTGTFTSDATAGASEIKKGYTAYVNGTKITGSYELDPTIIQAGVTVDGVTGTFTSDANATAAQIQSGKTAYVNGVKITGTLAPAAANIKTGVTIAGVTGTFTSDATATAAMIQSGKTAYINGVKVTGTLAPASSNIKVGATIAGVAGTFTADATATSGDHIRSGYTAYANGVKITGTYSGLDTSDATVTSSAHILRNYTAYSKNIKYTGSAPKVFVQTSAPTSGMVEGDIWFVNQSTARPLPVSNSGMSISGGSVSGYEYYTDEYGGQTAYNFSGTIGTWSLTRTQPYGGSASTMYVSMSIPLSASSGYGNTPTIQYYLYYVANGSSTLIRSGSIATTSTTITGAVTFAASAVGYFQLRVNWVSGLDGTTLTKTINSSTIAGNTYAVVNGVSYVTNTVYVYKSSAWRQIT